MQKKNTNILYVGDNVGIFTVYFAKLFYNCTIHYFELGTVTSELLNTYVELNNLKNVKTYKIGLGDDNYNIDINIDLNRLGSSSIHQNIFNGKFKETIVINK